MLPAEIQSALDDPYVKRFFAISTKEQSIQLPAADPSPRSDYAAVNYVRDAVLLRMTHEEVTCYQGFAGEQVLRDLD